MTDSQNSAKPFDLSELNTTEASDKGARVELVHPTTGEGLGMFFTVLGKHSQVFRELVRERVNKRLREDAQAQRRGKVVDRTAEEVEADAVQLLIACTISWDTEIREVDPKTKKTSVKEVKPHWLFNKEELSFNHANANRIYSQMLWVREQVDEAIGDLENFI